jgi:hypothetical protein
MNFIYIIRRGVVSVLLIFVLLLVLSGCDKPNLLPSPTISNPVYRPLIALDVEIDTPPLYNLGREVAFTVANKLDELASRINSGGIVVFVCRISSRSFEDCPVSFETPAIPAFVLPPPVPKCSSDPYQCSTLKGAYKKAFASWQVAHTRQVNNLTSVRAWVHQQTNKIRYVSFPLDANGSDILGALATGAQNLQGINAQSKYLLLATDFVSTTTMQDIGSFSLKGISVVAVYRTCSNNQFCQQSNSYWSNVLRSAGATGFQVYSPAQSQAFGLSF